MSELLHAPLARQRVAIRADKVLPGDTIHVPGWYPTTAVNSVLRIKRAWSESGQLLLGVWIVIAIDDGVLRHWDKPGECSLRMERHECVEVEIGS